MATLSPEQFQEFMSMMMTRGMHGQPSSSGSSSGRPHITVKDIRVDTFNGQIDKWEDWSFAFRRTIRSMSRVCYDLMVEAELSTEPVDTIQHTTEQDARSGELYDVLCQFCTGEALSVIKGVQDMEGIEAWQRLHRKYNPRTMARGVRMLCEVTSPIKLNDLRDVETEINKWEEKVRALKTQFGEELTNGMKIAILTNMMPLVIQDFIYTHVDKDTKYEEIKDKVKAITGNKLAMNMGPAPMDIGELKGGEEEDVGLVGAHVQCHRCHGYGHLARDCATSKGKGKTDYKGSSKGDGKASWKSGGKGDGKGYSKGSGKAAGKGYQGICRRCGKVGHKAAECRVKDVGEVDEELEAKGEEEVGGVWTIGAVDAKGVSRGTKELEKDLNSIEYGERLTKESEMVFNIEDVKKPVASAVKVCDAGNRIVMDPDPQKCYVEKVDTGERMKIRRENGTFVIDVQFVNGDYGAITLDSGAGVNVWPKQKLQDGKIMPKKEGLRMVAANGTDIQNYGQKEIKFRGVAHGIASVFTRQA